MASISIVVLPGWGNVLSHGSAPWPLSGADGRFGRTRARLPASPGVSAVVTRPPLHSPLAPRPARQVLVGAPLGDPYAASHGQTPRPPPLGVLFVAVAPTAQTPAHMHWIGIRSLRVGLYRGTYHYPLGPPRGRATAGAGARGWCRSRRRSAWRAL
jgi:hypothetical protein